MSPYSRNAALEGAALPRHLCRVWTPRSTTKLSAHPSRFSTDGNSCCQQQGFAHGITSSERRGPLPPGRARLPVVPIQPHKVDPASAAEERLPRPCPAAFGRDRAGILTVHVPTIFSTAFHRKNLTSCDEQPLLRISERARSPHARGLSQKVIRHRSIEGRTDRN